MEIITAKGATPNPSWSSFLVTAKARAAIRAYLKNLKRGEALELGKRLLGLALEEFSLNLKKIPAAEIDAVVKEFNLKDAAELYEKIGLGERLAPLVTGRARPFGERAARRDHRVAGIAVGRERGVGQESAVRPVHRERAAAGRAGEGTADVEPVVLQRRRHVFSEILPSALVISR